MLGLHRLGDGVIPSACGLSSLDSRNKAPGFRVWSGKPRWVRSVVMRGPGIERSMELLLVGYFLARCGPNEPPSQLGVHGWGQAYDVFFQALAGGRTRVSFARSMRNTRDDYDQMFRGTRVGWPVSKLSESQLAICRRWEHESTEALWEAVRIHADIASPGAR